MDKGGANQTGGFNLAESLGNPQDWSDEQVVTFIESRQPGIQLVALLRLANAQTDWAKARGYRHLARAQELNEDWESATVNWRKAFRIAWKGNLHMLTSGYLAKLAYCAHKSTYLHLSIGYSRLLFKVSEDPNYKAWAMLQLARCLYDTGDYEGMLACSAYALENASTDLDRTLARLRLSCAYNRLGRFEQALRDAQTARQEYEIQEREDGAMWAMGEIARALCGLGRYESALYVTREGREIAQKLNDNNRLGRVYVVIGMIHSRQEKARAAKIAFNKALGLLSRTHAPADEQEARRELAAVIARRKTA